MSKGIIIIESPTSTVDVTAQVVELRVTDADAMVRGFENEQAAFKQQMKNQMEQFKRDVSAEIDRLETTVYYDETTNELYEIKGKVNS